MKHLYGLKGRYFSFFGMMIHAVIPYERALFHGIKHLSFNLKSVDEEAESEDPPPLCIEPLLPCFCTAQKTPCHCCRLFTRRSHLRLMLTCALGDAQFEYYHRQSGLSPPL